MNRLRTYRWLAGIALLCSLPGYTATVYKTIDENGVVNYSDVKPPDEMLVETLQIDVSASPDGNVAAQRLDEMRATTDRMVADRMAREKHRAQMRQLDAQTQASGNPEEVTDYYDTSPVYTDYYPYTYPRQPWRPPYHPPRPEHPIAHPPLSPSQPNLPPGVRPLPGNAYPGSLISKGYEPNVRKALGY